MNLALIVPGNILEILIISNFWFSTLTTRFTRKKSLIIYYAVQIPSLFRNWLLYDHVLAKSLLAMTCSLILMRILFKDKAHRILGVFITYIVCTFLAELVAMFVAKYLYECDLQKFIQPTLPYYLWQATTYALLTIFSVTALILLKTKKIDIDDRTTQYTYLYVAIQCLSIVVVTMAMFHYKLLSTVMFVAVLVILIASTFFGVIIHNALKSAMGNVAEAEFLKKEAKIVSEHFRELKEQYTEFRSLRHDYLNHIRILKELKNPEKTTEYAEELEQRLSDMEKLSFCDNMALDALLSVKKRKAEQLGVRLIAEICNLEDIRISDFDLCTVVSNLLDNAIEAASKTSEKGVFMHIGRKLERLIITVKNNSLPVSQSMKSTKQNKKEHGIGMQNIRKIAEKYEGDYVYKYENGEFFTSVNMVL